MTLQVQLRSKEQILADLIRSILINTDINDVSPGSSLGTLLEAIATSHFKIAASALKILESSNLESLVGADLDKKAISIKIPNGVGGFGRKPATRAINVVVIGSDFQKISSKQYSGKPAPFAGSTKLYLEDASKFPAPGPNTKIYIGRGTVDRFEGPILYTSLVNSGSYWEMTLANPLTKNHLSSDLVVLAQGGDRIVPAGTTVQVSSANGIIPVQFQTTEELVIADGEAEGTVQVVCTQAGEVGNVLAGAITEFVNSPFSGATVINRVSFNNGSSSESDEDLRIRIKNYPSTLSRGTATAILSALQGAIDPATGRSIQSAVVLEPIEPGDSAKVFIDDNTGLEPTFDGQAYELLRKSASGQEKKFRTAQYPITPAVAIGTNFGPFSIKDSMSLTVQIDEIIETYTITPSNYKNLNSVNAYEISRDFNNQSNIVGFRTLDEGTRIAIFDLSGQAELLKIEAGELQKILGLPTVDIRPLYLYKDSILQSFRGKTATLETRPKNLWATLGPLDLTNVRVNVDGVIQTFTINDSDFVVYGTTMNTASINQWAEVFSKKIAGVKFTVAANRIIWSSWQQFSSKSYLEILPLRSDNTPAPWIDNTKIWLPKESGGKLSDRGYEKDYKLNRFTGEINFINKPSSGQTIEIASENTRAFINSLEATTGLFDVSPHPDFGNSRFVVGFDGQFEIRDVPVPNGSTISIDTDGDSRRIRIDANNIEVFKNAKAGDYLYLAKNNTLTPSWASDIEGLYLIKKAGHSKYATNQTFSGLSAKTGANAASLTITLSVGSRMARVTHNNHNFKSGDKISIEPTTGAGGLTAAEITVTDAPIVVIDSNNYEYRLTSTNLPTSDDSVTALYFNSSVIEITHTNHGFKTGARIQVNSIASSPFGGKTLAQINTPPTGSPDPDFIVLEVKDPNTYYIRCDHAGSGTNSTVQTTTMSLTYFKDCYIIFYKPNPTSNTTSWDALFTNTYNIDKGTINLFKSSVIPQVVNLGPISTTTIDNAVSIINSQISSGTCEKINPKQLRLRSNNFINGTAAILCVIGNITSIFKEPIVAQSIQPHTANAPSSYVSSGFPVIKNYLKPGTAGLQSRVYLDSSKDDINILQKTSDSLVRSSFSGSLYPVGFETLWVTGNPYLYQSRLYQSELTFPYEGILSSSDSIKHPTEFYSISSLEELIKSNYSIKLDDLPINNHDKLVVEMDLNPADKTVAINLAKLAKIETITASPPSGKGSLINFTLKDPEDSDKPFSDFDSVYRQFNFRDFKILAKNVGVFEIASSRYLYLRSTAFGAPSRLHLSLQEPTEPNVTELQVTHVNDFEENDARTTLIITLKSGALLDSKNFGNYRIRSAGTLLNNYLFVVSSSDLSAVTNNILNISGGSPINGSFSVSSSKSGNYSGASASVTNGSPTVTVTAASHDLVTGDIVTITTSSSIGGILPINLSITDAVVTVIDANTFSYQATASATSTATGTLDSVVYELVTFLSPANPGITSSIYSASIYPLKVFDRAQITMQELSDAINNYLPENPLATAEINQPNTSSFFVLPTYRNVPSIPLYTGSDLNKGFLHRVHKTKYSGYVGVRNYNTLTADFVGLLQTDETLFPTATETAGSGYSAVNEEVYIVPTNTNTLRRWIDFNAASSLNVLANIEKINSDQNIQISSKEAGEAGAVKITGVSANKINSPILGNSSEVEQSTVIKTLFADAKALPRKTLVKISNKKLTELSRPYKLMPTGTSITSANTVDIDPFFRQTNSIKYIRVNQNKARIVFLRNGKGNLQTEPLTGVTQVTLTNLGSGLVQVGITAGTGVLSARVGDLMYIRYDSNFPIDAKCPPIPSSGSTVPSRPEYIGYTVVDVIDDQNIIIVAPNITTFGAVTIVSNTDIVFLPAIWNEKNIRSDKKEGVLYKEPNSALGFNFIIKTLGNGFCYLNVYNDPTNTASNNSMKLSEMLVNTDDYLELSTNAFDPANQGRFRIIAHNGKDQIFFYNPNGGKDQVIDLNNSFTGSSGTLFWTTGRVSSGGSRAIRVLDSDCVKIGDYLRISSPTATSQWFNQSMIGNWKITGIGYQALDYTGFSLPHSINDGNFDIEYLAPYIEIDLPNAPVAILDSSGNPVDSFLIGANQNSIGFIEEKPIELFRIVAGHSLNPNNTEESDIFLIPRKNSGKISEIFDSVLSVPHKINFDDKVFSGLDGYKVFSGLIRQAHRIIDGLPTNPNLFPGFKAAGTIIEVLPPLIKSIEIDLQVRPKDGVTLNSLTDLVKATVEKYINSVGVGKPVIISEIIRVVQGLPGVFSVTVLATRPAAIEDRIVTSETEKPFVINVFEDISVG